MTALPTGGTGATAGDGSGVSIGGEFVSGNPEFASAQQIEYGVNSSVPGGMVTDQSDFGVNPNQKPYQMAVPVRGGDTATIQAFVQLGTFGSTIYTVFPSTDGRVVPTMTALATINATTTSVTVACNGFPFLLVVLDTVHGSSGNYHSIQATITRKSGA